MKIWLTEGSTGVLQSPFLPSLPPLMRDLPDSRFDKNRRQWTFYATPAACHSLIGGLQAIGITPEVDAAIEAMAQRWSERLDRAAAIKAIPIASFVPHSPAGMKTTPWRHQAKGFEFAVNEDGALLGMFMGVGKSLTTLALLCEWGAKKVLIACPKAVIGVWRRETDQHTPGTFRTICLDKGTGAKKAIQVRNAIRLYSGATIIVANYEAIIAGALGKELLQHDWDAVVCDEIHRIKGNSTLCSKMMYAIGKRSKKRLGLSGTPMVQGPIDLYGEFRFLDAGVFGTSVGRFRDKYCIMNPALPSVIVSYKNQDELKAKFDTMCITVTLDDASLDLPPLSHERLPIELEPEAQRIHDALWDDSVAKFGDLGELIENMVADKKDNRVTAGNILTQLLRLSQITSGHVVNDLGEVKRVSTAKKEALAEIVSNLPLREPVVVFCRFREDIKMVEEVAAATGKRYGEISGKRKDLTPQATLPDTVDLVAVQWQSGGAGIDLSRASYGVVYSSTYSGGDFNQGISRLHRPGQKRPTTFYHLVATNTVDQKVYAALARKQKLIERITNG